ncbi:MAG: hypothetical protein ACM3UU_06235 [Ignavibacteriales bacterium]
MKIKIQLILLLISLLTATLIISSGFGSWQDNLSVDISIKTAEKFKGKKVRNKAIDYSCNESNKADKETADSNIEPSSTSDTTEANDSPTGSENSSSTENESTSSENSDANNTGDGSNSSDIAGGNNAGGDPNANENSDINNTNLE